MIGVFLLWQGLIISYVISDYRAQKFIELLVCSNVFKRNSFYREAIIFLHKIILSVVIFKWFLRYLRVTQ